MEKIYLIKRFNGQIGWEIDITNLSYERVLQIILDEFGDDYQIKRTGEANETS